MITIYGIEETDFRCGGCVEAKRLLAEAGLEYEFKRIIYKNEHGDVAYDNELMVELRKRVHFKTLLLPYIFFDHELVKIANLKAHIGLDE
ncbi:NrdH glutaredoxin [Acinetobacter phage Acj9]|uniref:NrdH glutaredoxin n=1 Tax=Acinetobacter phage Acj9 TaxID=760939 RepID=E5EPQ3_9CAUD|nr:NrdH glutaredoxin [Acinetobacter phage Acj9]ADG60019.1 NrdH glutaredoxin [Acinetobacter phage Acj9]